MTYLLVVNNHKFIIVIYLCNIIDKNPRAFTALVTCKLVADCGNEKLLA